MDVSVVTVTALAWFEAMLTLMTVFKEMPGGAGFPLAPQSGLPAGRTRVATGEFWRRPW